MSRDYRNSFGAVVTIQARLAGRKLGDLTDGELAALSIDQALSTADQELAHEMLRRRQDSHSHLPSPVRMVMVGIDMPFMNRVTELVLWALAAIPALIILAIVGVTFVFLLSAAKS